MLLCILGLTFITVAKTNIFNVISVVVYLLVMLMKRQPRLLQKREAL